MQLYFDYRSQPVLNINQFAVDGNSLISFEDGIYVDLASRQQRKCNKDLKEYTKYLTKEILIQWWETKTFECPAKFGKN